MLEKQDGTNGGKMPSTEQRWLSHLSRWACSGSCCSRMAEAPRSAPSPRRTRRTVVAHLSRFRPLALFVRLPFGAAHCLMGPSLDQTCAKGRLAAIPRDAALFLSAESVLYRHGGASWEQAERCPRSLRIVSPGRLTTSKRDSTWRRHARAPSYGPTHSEVFRVPFGLALS